MKTIAANIIIKIDMSKLDYLIPYLLFLTAFNLNLSAQTTTKPDSGWQIFLDDSLIISSNLNVNYHYRPIAVIDIEKGGEVSNLTIIYKTLGAFRSLIEFKEKDSTLFQINGYYAERPVGDTLIIKSEYHYSELKSLKGKNVRILYSDDKFQTTPTLLGTLIVKND